MGCCDTSGSCSTESTSETLSCPSCTTTGKTVELRTVRALVRPEAKDSVREDSSYAVCHDSECRVVYFEAGGSTLTEAALTTRVGFKQGPAPHPICYCFGLTEESIADEIHRTGATGASAMITAEVKAGRCECETKNPTGKCCLGDIRRVEKAAIAKSRRDDAEARATAAMVGPEPAAG